MRPVSLVRKSIGRLLWWVASIPLFFKIMGIGLLVGAVFGGITLWQIHGSVSHTLHKALQERTRSLAYTLTDSLQRPMTTGDAFSVDERLQRTRQMFSDVRYIIARDAKGGIVSHTFEKDVPEDLLRPPHALPPVTGEAVGKDRFRVLDAGDELVFEVTCLILDGRAGSLQLGVTDQMVTRELTSIRHGVWWTLALCALIGAGLAVLLTHILTRPIYHLVGAANRVRGGDFHARSEVFSADEIGRLAVAFNQMAESLQDYRQAVQEKERSRQSLMERIVYAQEEERRSISRELHDQLGQSLLALMLKTQSVCKEYQTPQSVCDDIEIRIRQLIEEVRRLAWGMRPSILDDYGLDSALARHVAEVSEHSGLPIDYQYSCSPGLGRLPGRIEVTLYRIAQEALANIVRHARATRTSAIVLRRSDEVILLVEDNGRGFHGNSVQQDGAGCLGLTGMKERAALLGGTCAVESVPEQGTTIRVRIPLERD